MVNLEALRRAVENEIERYRYPAGAVTIGIPWTPDRVNAELVAMRASIVAPYWVDVELHDTFEQIGRLIAGEQAVLHKVVVVADDAEGMLVAFDPINNEFLLVQRAGDVLITIGVRGDAVGCFMSR